jgi:NADPH-dependent ferric siderophore reductase
LTTTTFPLPPNLLAIPGVQALELEVVEVANMGVSMRSIRLRGAGLDTFAYQPGQDVMLVLGQAGDRPLSRRYTIRSFDPATRTLALCVVAHGVDGPGARWANDAQPGDRVNGVGPRGKIFLDGVADWHLFVGDETAAPASLVMLEAVADDTPGAAYLEVAGADDELPMLTSSPAHQVSWLHRHGVAGAASQLLVDALQSAPLPRGTGHAYIAGEVQLVATLRGVALARGLAPEQVSAKAYWSRGRANALRGEPD